MSKTSIHEVAGARESRAFFAALLEACRSNCNCNTCRILRSIAESMSSEFLIEGVESGKGKRKA